MDAQNVFEAIHRGGHFIIGDRVKSLRPVMTFIAAGDTGTVDDYLPSGRYLVKFEDDLGDYIFALFSNTEVSLV